MAEKRQWNAALNAKGLEASVSEDQAGEMCRRLGDSASYVFIIAAHPSTKTVGEDGTEKVNLVIDEVELIPRDQEDRVRRFKRALHLARPGSYGQEAFDGITEGEPSVDDTGRDLDAAVTTDDTGQPTGIWDGDTDGPLDPEDEKDGCDFPGCTYAAEHDGDHSPEAQEPPKAKGKKAAGGNVVAPDFSAKG